MTKEKSIKIKERLYKYQNSMECVYWFILGFILVTEVLSSTQVGKTVLSMLTGLMQEEDVALAVVIWQMVLNLRLLIIVPAFYTVVFKAKDWKSRIFMLLLISVGWYYSYYWRMRDDVVVFNAVLVMVASYQIDFKKILRFGMRIFAGLLGVIILLSVIGVLPDCTNEMNGRVLHSFGFSAPEALTAHFLFLLLAYLYLKDGMLHLIEMVLMTAGVTLIGVLSGNAGFVIYSVIALMGCVIYEVFQKKGWKLQKLLKKIWGVVMLLSYGLFGTIFMFLAFTYSAETIEFFSRFPILAPLNERLEVAYRVTRIFPFSWFGNYFLQLKPGMPEAGNLTFSTFLDCSYARIYVMYGVVAFALILLLFTVFQYRLWRNERMFRMFIVFLIAVIAVMEHYLIEPGYNLILLLPFADLLNHEKYDQQTEMVSDDSKQTGIKAK